MKGARHLVDILRSKQYNDKSLGQHFLINDQLIADSVSYGEVDADDHVLEIGPGPGVLTEALLAKGCRVTAIEIDAGAVKHLQNQFSTEINQGSLVVQTGDALTVAWPDNVTKVIANIPYQISSPLVDLLTRYLRNQWLDSLVKVVLLVQEEFAERLVMEYDSDVGSLGMTALLDWRSEILAKVAPHNFSPNPKVNSCFIEMIPSHEKFNIDKRLVKQIIHQAFNQRRKKLRTTLKATPKRLNRLPNWYAERWRRAYQSLMDDERMDLRPEDLDFDDWVKLAQDVAQIGPS
ncbi:MAG TPA: ribosomal RNA small subunit methyltransferase A [Candidatus Poseidoniaceae archaeon]|nr:ribosomal RNA small subunit methyltransferase A [Euryarchaeota archaeon]DAC59191.1 MAG TPA: ribosomal RNA small subunit methyltransferase A [Candidatus Poseidoniales archaeon]HII37332.1 ribosomal RNA small subunit methyltransferase A [Candidatus Poseidoniaceae archaeon]|tara:strand:- start:300 stop:1172 length:873 start_codon:yes stop_codon:yes gene_type:complete